MPFGLLLMGGFVLAYVSGLITEQGAPMVFLMLWLLFAAGGVHGWSLMVRRMHDLGRPAPDIVQSC